MENLHAPRSAIAASLLLSLPLVAANSALAAGDASIRGVVTDDAGSPVRGAIVRAQLGNTLHARYSDGAGRYEIDGLEPGQYDVTVDALGFALATQQAEAENSAVADFSLTPHWDVARLNTAQLKHLLPQTDEMTFLVNRCGNCHGMETVISSAAAGMPAEAWEAFLQVMPNRRMAVDRFSPELAERLAPLIVEHFGTGGSLRRLEQADFAKVQLPRLNDAALQAKITEYKIPSRDAMPHTVRVDRNSGLVWWTM